MPKKRDYQKEARHKAITQLVESQSIKTQMDLLDQLKQAGYNVTQATISRDIRELQIGKSAGEGGEYQYVLTRKPDNLKRFEMMLGDSVINIDYAGTIVIVKCLTGMANAVCELFDSERVDWGDVVGTLSGDNTFIIMMRSEAEAAALCEKLSRLIGY